MKMNNRKKMLLVCAMASVFCTGLAVTTWNEAAATTDLEVKNIAIVGGSLRYMEAGSEENGIRFAVAIDENFFADNLLNTAKDGFKEEVTVGGLVLPQDYTADTQMTKDTQLTVENK